MIRRVPPLVAVQSESAWMQELEREWQSHSGGICVRMGFCSSSRHREICSTGSRLTTVGCRPASRTWAMAPPWSRLSRQGMRSSSTSVSASASAEAIPAPVNEPWVSGVGTDQLIGISSPSNPYAARWTVRMRCSRCSWLWLTRRVAASTATAEAVTKPNPYQAS